MHIYIYVKQRGGGEPGGEAMIYCGSYVPIHVCELALKITDIVYLLPHRGG